MSSLLQSISSFFSPSSPQHHSRDQAMSSIDDAFSIPTDPEYGSTYTYPPPPHYDNVPSASSSSSSSRPHLLPLHHSPNSPLPNYPPLQQTWARLRSWLHDQYPELADTLNWGIPAPDLGQLELQLDIALPPAVRDSYLLVDGQEPESAAGCSDGLFFGLTLLPLEDVVDEWRFWREVDDDPATGANPALRDSMRSIPPGWIRREYSQRGWLPLVADKAGNYLGVDMNPDERGAPGQVIVFGRDFDTKVVMWRGDGQGGWARWLASFVDDLYSGEGFELGTPADISEGSEDDLGYESYFFDGTGKGEGGGGERTGGLRLTGEYRGWPVLEALADRSMKRWIEAGVMPAPTPVHASTSDSVEVSLEPVASSSKAPVTTDLLPITTQENGDAMTLFDPPNIAITRPPAPLPVRLPTERDLLPSPLYSSPTEAETPYGPEESDLPMREVDPRTTPVQANFSGPPAVEPATLVPLPASDEPPSTSTASPMPESARCSTTDSLLGESQALLGDASPTPGPPSPAGDPALPAAQAALVSAIFTPTVEPLEFTDDEAVQRPSGRLVGGGTRDASLVEGGPGLDKKLAVDRPVVGGSARRKTEAAC